MMEVKYAGIKLFGKKIALPKNGKIPVVSGDDSAGESSGGFAHDSSSSEPNVSLVTTTRSCLEDRKMDRVGEAAEEEAEKDHLAAEHSETKPQDKDPTTITEESTNSKSSDDSPKTPSIGEETASLQSPNTENDQSDDATNSQKRTLKKPDKILPCPRCSSMETKFCYYNNYNINQQRHFCKSCQRYWTAGGAMRNVAVGAGRRKNKNWAQHCHHIAVSEGLRAAQIGAPNGTHCPTFKTNGAVLSLSSEGSRLCESMAFPSSLAEKKVPLNNGFYKVQQGISGSCRGKENSDDYSSGSSATTLDNSIVEVGKKKEIHEPTMQKNIHGFPSQVPFFSGVVPWSYPWNSAIPVPTICPSGIAIPSHPAPYWNCNFAGAWNIPWLSPDSPPSPAITQKASDSSLGKHTRDGDLINPSIPKEQLPLEQKNFEISSSVLIPKTLRIDDPKEAAKSSIWATLGIKAFQAKGDGSKGHVITTSPVLQANPAAMSRFLVFQERA